MYKDFIHSAEAMRRTRFATPSSIRGTRLWRRALGEALIRVGSHLISEPARSARIVGASS